jgi:hypothetical protein
MVSYAQAQVMKKDSTKNSRMRSTVSLPVRHPLIVIKSKGNTYEIDTVVYSEGLLKHINPQWISSIDVIKPSEGKSKYMESASNGVLIITLSDKLYPNAFRILEMYLKKDKKGK